MFADRVHRRGREGVEAAAAAGAVRERRGEVDQRDGLAGLLFEARDGAHVPGGFGAGQLVTDPGAPVERGRGDGRFGRRRGGGDGALAGARGLCLAATVPAAAGADAATLGGAGAAFGMLDGGFGGVPAVDPAAEGDVVRDVGAGRRVGAARAQREGDQEGQDEARDDCREQALIWLCKAICRTIRGHAKPSAAAPPASPLALLLDVCISPKSDCLSGRGSTGRDRGAPPRTRPS